MGGPRPAYLSRTSPNPYKVKLKAHIPAAILPSWVWLWDHRLPPYETVSSARAGAMAYAQSLSTKNSQ